jgi:hypothetical protein
MECKGRFLRYPALMSLCFSGSLWFLVYTLLSVGYTETLYVVHENGQSLSIIPLHPSQPPSEIPLPVPPTI